MPFIMSNRTYARRKSRFRRAYWGRYWNTPRRYGMRRVWRRQYAYYAGRIPVRRRGRITGFR